MILQDYFPADLTLLGLRNIYSQVGKDSFYIQSPCVISKDKLLTKGKHYLIFDVPKKTGIKMKEIVLIDLFFYKGNIHVISEDIYSHRVSNISFCLESQKNDCTLFVVDLSYFIDKMDDRAIRDYCGCDNDKKKPNIEGKPKSYDDLLDFDF
jgi:hypothetical protein